MTNPNLTAEEVARLKRLLSQARLAVKYALATKNNHAEWVSGHAVDRAKIALGERGPVWWVDGAPDYNRHLLKNTPYAHLRFGAQDALSEQPG